MFSPDLIVTLVILAWTGAVAFFAYWLGHNHGILEGRVEAERYLDELDETTRIISEMARQRHPSQRLRVVREES